MNKIAKLLVGGAVLGAFLLCTVPNSIQARILGRLYGNSLHIEAEPRSATPSVTLGDDDAYIEGTFEVDGAARFDGTMTTKAITATGVVTVSTIVVGVSLTPVNGAACTTGQLATTSTRIYGCPAGVWRTLAVTDSGTPAIWTNY